MSYTTVYAFDAAGDAHDYANVRNSYQGNDADENYEDDIILWYKHILAEHRIKLEKSENLLTGLPREDS